MFDADAPRTPMEFFAEDCPPLASGTELKRLVEDFIGHHGWNPYADFDHQPACGTAELVAKRYKRGVDNLTNVVPPAQLE
eukprot:5260406-Pyramimonas_sp.AAC.4